MPAGGDRAFDIILWGATGYTGQLAAEYLGAQSKELPKLKWAIGGRKRSLLVSLAEEVREKAGLSANLQYVIAQTDNEESMRAMSSSCCTLVSFVGPYTLMGEAAVKACLATETNYVDVTAEMIWLSKMSKKYNDEAREKRLKMIFACGFDFVPNDMMMLQLTQVLSNPSYAKWCPQPREVTHSFKQTTPMVSGGTAWSGMELVKSLDFRSVLGYYIDPYAMCSEKTMKNVDNVVKELNSFAISPRYVPEIDAYCTPFVMSSLMHKFIHWSNELQAHPWGVNLVYRGGEQRESMWLAYLYSVIIWLQFFLLVMISRLPLLWRFLPAPGTGPPIDAETSTMESTLVAAVPPISAAGESVSVGEENIFKVSWKMKGGEAYKAAAIFAVEGALTITLNNSDLPDRYGVLSPAAGLGAAYLKRLEATPIRMNVLEIPPTSFK